MEQPAQGSGHSPELPEFKEHLGNTQRKNFGWSQELDSTIFWDPFQYGVFYDFVILLFCARLQSVGGAMEDKKYRAFISGALPKLLASLQLHGRVWSKCCIEWET